MIEAQGEYVVVEFIPQQESKTTSGIIIAKDDRKRDGDVVYLATGKLISAGDKADLPRVRIGDTILYTPIDANRYQHESVTYDVLNYKHVKGKV
jgi:co-chaperonin GroES (HSP10)